MPIVQGYSRRAIATNIATERAAGKPEGVAKAIALSAARRAALRKRTVKGAAAALRRLKRGDVA